MQQRDRVFWPAFGGNLKPDLVAIQGGAVRAVLPPHRALRSDHCSSSPLTLPVESTAIAAF
jgi:hypothetical protein